MKYLLNIWGVDIPCTLDARPSINIEEIAQDDGTFLPGDQHWSILIAHFESKQSLQFENNVTGFIYVLDDNDKILEKWVLENVRSVCNGFQIALAFDHLFYERS